MYMHAYPKHQEKSFILIHDVLRGDKNEALSRRRKIRKYQQSDIAESPSQKTRRPNQHTEIKISSTIGPVF